MKIKPLFVLPTSPLSFSQSLPWLGIYLLLAISFGFTQFISSIDVTGIDLALALGIALGIILEIKFDLETLFVGGLIGVMILAFVLMVLLMSLSNSFFKLIFILASTTTVVAIGCVLVQWLIKNWICRSWGKATGIIISEIAISLGVGLHY
ncbi:hypothetical protein I4641_05320 [Waterburya agarophytonicola K14]|uniref:Uncharacterized protein n=1 Tax=Waterburya agarophytonicola KI4 TaxID=2874699 RepID=A0A964FEY3_9CYAN|nr:hypothetical protein [Waterburya agarophytonicola]MCC0176396.1 hypothetical protein [Waterburya agarophytonicola KI4]